MLRSPSLIPARSYGDDPDYIDEEGYEVRYNKTKPLKQTQKGRFTIIEPLSSIHDIKEIKNTIRDLKPVNSYGDDPDYIDEEGYEVRYNKTKPLKQTQKGRFTIIEPLSSIHDIKEIKKTIRNLKKQEKKIIVKNPEKFYELNGKQIGRFKVTIRPMSPPRVKSRTRAPSRSRPRSPSRSRPLSVSRPRSNDKQIERYSFVPVVDDPHRIINPEYSHRFEFVDNNENLI